MIIFFADFLLCLGTWNLLSRYSGMLWLNLVIGYGAMLFMLLCMFLLGMEKWLLGTDILFAVCSILISIQAVRVAMKKVKSSYYDAGGILMLRHLCAQQIGQWEREHLLEELGNAEDAKRFENVTIPAQIYVVCETERCKYPTMVFLELRKKIVEEWLPSSGYVLTEAPEISVTHWFRKPDSEKRYMELWLPVAPCGD